MTLSPLAMSVVPFPARPEPAALEFAIGARVDLRIGALASGVVRPRSLTAEAFAFSVLARTLRGARMSWRERGAHAPLTLALSAELHQSFDAALLSEAAMEAGCTRQKLSFELSEAALAAHGQGLAEDLRARGWPLALRADPAFPLPLCAKARALYSEIVLDAPETPDPFLAVEDSDASSLGRRLLAARAAELVVTAANVQSPAQARMLAIAGFDRGGGPFAEGRLR
jgi:hypothetical protein